MTDLFLGPVPWITWCIHVGFPSTFLDKETWSSTTGKESGRNRFSALRAHCASDVFFQNVFQLHSSDSFPSGFYLPQAAVFSIENHTLTSLFFTCRVFSSEMLFHMDDTHWAFFFFFSPSGKGVPQILIQECANSLSRSRKHRQGTAVSCLGCASVLTSVISCVVPTQRLEATASMSTM